MGYTYVCDGFCGDAHDSAPPFMGSFSEQFIKTSPSILAQMFDPGETVTMCRECSELLFESGKLAVCRRCGWGVEVSELPPGVETCPRCDEGEFDFTEVET